MLAELVRDRPRRLVLAMLAPERWGLTTGRLVAPQEIADAVAFLASPRFGSAPPARTSRSTPATLKAT